MNAQFCYPVEVKLNRQLPTEATTKKRKKKKWSGKDDRTWNKWNEVNMSLKNLDWMSCAELSWAMLRLMMMTNIIVVQRHQTLIIIWKDEEERKKEKFNVKIISFVPFFFIIEFHFALRTHILFSFLFSVSNYCLWSICDVWELRQRLRSMECRWRQYKFRKSIAHSDQFQGRHWAAVTSTFPIRITWFMLMPQKDISNKYSFSLSHTST